MIQQVLDLIRPNIRRLAPYSTARDEFSGGNIDVWIDANESPYNNGVNRYPDPHQRLLKQRISAILGAPAESIFLGGAGSDEAIDLVFRIFCEPGKDSAIAITPSYGVYSVAADINNVALRAVELNPDFSLPVDRILAAVTPDTKVVWVCSPNNPTGNAFPVADLIRLAEGLNAVLVVDEAYGDFSDRPSMAAQISRLPNVIVLRTFSKAWGMAGMRCGMALAHPEVIRFFDRVKYPYNMSSVIQDMLLKRLDTPPTAQIAEIRSERRRLADAIASAPCVLAVYPSDANFLLVRLTDAARIYGLLSDGGVLVRNRSSLPLCHGCLRITVGTPAENTRVINILNSIMP